MPTEWAKTSSKTFHLQNENHDIQIYQETITHQNKSYLVFNGSRFMGVLIYKMLQILVT